MVNIVHIGLLVYQLYQIFDDRGDISLGQYPDSIGDIKIQLGVDTVTTDLAQVVTLVGEEQFLDNATRRFLVWGFGIAQLAIDILNSLFRVV